MKSCSTHRIETRLVAHVPETRMCIREEEEWGTIGGQRPRVADERTPQGNMETGARGPCREGWAPTQKNKPGEEVRLLVRPGHHGSAMSAATDAS